MKTAGVRRKNAGFVVKHGYNSCYSGNYYVFLGVCSNKLYHFYRPFSGDWQRLTKQEALELFVIGAGRKDEQPSQDYPSIEAYIVGGRI